MLSASLEISLVPTYIPRRTYRFLSNCRSQALLGPVSTGMGDRFGKAGAVGKELFYLFSTVKLKFTYYICFTAINHTSTSEDFCSRVFTFLRVFSWGFENGKIWSRCGR